MYVKLSVAAILFACVKYASLGIFAKVSSILILILSSFDGTHVTWKDALVLWRLFVETIQGQILSTTEINTEFQNFAQKYNNYSSIQIIIEFLFLSTRFTLKEESIFLETVRRIDRRLKELSFGEETLRLRPTRVAALDFWRQCNVNVCAKTNATHTS